MYINTHSHIYDKAFDDDREVVLQRAIDAGITMLIVPNNDLGSIKPLHEFYEKHQDYCKVMMGLHPEEIKDDYKKKSFNNRKRVGTGYLDRSRRNRS